MMMMKKMVMMMVTGLVPSLLLAQGLRADPLLPVQRGRPPPPLLLMEEAG